MGSVQSETLDSCRDITLPGVGGGSQGVCGGHSQLPTQTFSLYAPGAGCTHFDNQNTPKCLLGEKQYHLLRTTGPENPRSSDLGPGVAEPALPAAAEARGFHLDRTSGPEPCDPDLAAAQTIRARSAPGGSNRRAPLPVLLQRQCFHRLPGNLVKKANSDPVAGEGPESVTTKVMLTQLVLGSLSEQQGPKPPVPQLQQVTESPPGRVEHRWPGHPSLRPPLMELCGGGPAPRSAPPLKGCGIPGSLRCLIPQSPPDTHPK